MLSNESVAEILSRIALLLQIRGDNKFKVRAFENAATAIENLSTPLNEIDDWTNIYGIGKSIATEIDYILKNNRSETFDSLKNELGEKILELTKINGLGPKRIKQIYDELGIRSLEDLKGALEDHQLDGLKGFGPKLCGKIEKEIERLSQIQGLTPLPAAREIADTFVARFAAREDVAKANVAGSTRRGKEMVGDIDILVATQCDSAPIFDAFVAFPEVDDVLVRGETKTSVLLQNGIQVDVRIVAPSVYGAALCYFTGNKEINVELRTIAKQRDLKVNEYGVFQVGSETPIASETEEDVFAALGLRYIPPELREDPKVVKLATSSDFDFLVTEDEIKGDLHMHTVESDGANSIIEMAESARARGLEYIAITDHSQLLTVANGMTPDRFAAHIERIRSLNGEVDGIRLLAGIEVDIRKDGTLDMDHDLLSECDWVVGSIHLSSEMSVSVATHRLVAAIETGLLNTIGHPTGRILGGRSGYMFDFEEVVGAANAFGTAFEMNGSWGRLDLNAAMARRVVDNGGYITFGSDAHSTDGLGAMEFAVQQARRAMIEKGRILNTYRCEDLLARKFSSSHQLT